MLNSGHLRVCQILVFLVAGTAGLVVSISVGWTSKIVKGPCVLFSNMALKKTGNGSIIVMLDSCVWGTDLQCAFSTFCPVGLTIYCIIWIWFYIFLSDWGTTFIETKEEKERKEPNRPPPDQHLLIPSIVCNIVVLALQLTTVALVEAGKSVWCEHVMDVLKEPSCSYVKDVVWVNLKGGQDLYRYLSHATMASWVLLLSLVMQTVIMFVRLRRNSLREQLDSSDSESENDDVHIESGHFNDSSGDSDSSDINEMRAARKRPQRQRRVTINVSVSSTDRESSEAGASLMQNVDYNEQPV